MLAGKIDNMHCSNITPLLLSFWDRYIEAVAILFMTYLITSNENAIIYKNISKNSLAATTF